MEKDPNGLSAHAPGAKLDAGKPFAGLIMDFGPALKAVVAVGTFGARKYSRGGWKSVPDAIQRYTDAKFRHELDLACGETHDPESGYPHDWHVLWNQMAIVTLKTVNGMYERIAK